MSVGRRGIGVLLTCIAIVMPGFGVSQADVCPPDPYPCGNEWPEGLVGPFELASVEYVKVPSFDGTMLEGWIGMPSVPAGVKVPVALHVNPYFGDCSVLGTQCTSEPSQPAFWTSEPSGIPPAERNNGEEWTWGIAPIGLIRHGIAAAFFTVRGTMNSGGCFEFGGPNEQRDQRHLVDWLAAQDWSNERVAMGGHSYGAFTAFQAGVSAPAALKTVVASGIVTDLTLFHQTPQGAAMTATPPSWTYLRAMDTILPPAGSPPQRAVVEHLPLLTERACPEVIEASIREYEDVVADHRRSTYYDERRMSHRLGNITAATLVAHGFRDYTGQAFQDSEVWHHLRNAPKRMIVGSWGHTFPMPEVANLDSSWDASTWDEILLEWLDYWLWGKGSPPENLGEVGYQDQRGTWRSSGAWPPGREEVLYLSGASVATMPSSSARTFRSVPTVMQSYADVQFLGVPFNAWPDLCADSAGQGLVYLSEPLDREATIAGNPFAYLNITSSEPGGIVGVHLVGVPADFDCTATESQVNVIAAGAADLRFHAGGYDAHDFPVGTPTKVRIDLWDGSATIGPGERIAVLVGYGEAGVTGHAGKPFAPEITVHGDSEIVVPFTDGTLGGSPPHADYPPRPFSYVSERNS